MRKIVIYLMLIFLVSCAQGSYREYSYHKSRGNLDDSGILLFRAINKNFTDKISGFLVNFKNLDTGEIIKNVPGVWGYPKETEFALIVPPGEYELSYVFLYDGGVSPKEIGFRVAVTKGEILYVGTILKSWGFPDAVSTYGNLIAVKQYSAKQYCAFWVCGEKGAEVYIFTSGEIPPEIFQRYPSIDKDEVKIRLLR